MTFERVLVATDFSDHSMRAARLARRLAPRAEFRFAHVLRPFLPQPLAIRADPGVVELALRRVEEEAEREIAAFARDVPAPGAATRILAGSVGGEINREAASFRADLVALGARGKSPAERLLIGSTARAILHATHVSLLVSRGADAGEHAVKRILVATDFQDVANAAAERAATIARETGAEVVLHHAVDAGVFGTILDLPEAQARGHARGDRKWVEDAVKELLRDLNAKTFDGKAREAVTTGRPGDEIAAVAARERADLVVMGTHGARALERALLGSVANELVEKAPCSVLVVRE